NTPARFRRSSETFLEPASDAPEVVAFMRRKPAPRFEMLASCELRIGSKARDGRKCGAARRLIKTRNRARLGYAHARAKHAACKFADSAELRTAAGEYDAASRQVEYPGRRHALVQHLEDLVDTGAHDPDHLCPRGRVAPVAPFDRRDHNEIG